jgi:hypothetical protein
MLMEDDGESGIGQENDHTGMDMGGGAGMGVERGWCCDCWRLDICSDDVPMEEDGGWKAWVLWSELHVIAAKRRRERAIFSGMLGGIYERDLSLEHEAKWEAVGYAWGDLLGIQRRRWLAY